MLNELGHDTWSHFSDVQDYFQTERNLKTIVFKVENNLRSNNKPRINKDRYECARLRWITNDKLEKKKFRCAGREVSSLITWEQNRGNPARQGEPVPLDPESNTWTIYQATAPLRHGMGLPNYSCEKGSKLEDLSNITLLTLLYLCRNDEENLKLKLFRISYHIHNLIER